MLQGTTDPLYATCGIKKQNAKRNKWNQIGSIQQKLLFVHICTLHWFNVIKNAYAKIEIEKKNLQWNIIYMVFMWLLGIQFSMELTTVGEPKHHVFIRL